MDQAGRLNNTAQVLLPYPVAQASISSMPPIALCATLTESSPLCGAGMGRRYHSAAQLPGAPDLHEGVEKDRALNCSITGRQILFHITTDGVTHDRTSSAL